MIDISGSTRLFVIVGDPIAQVGSPRLFNALFAERGVDAVLVPLHVSPADLPGVLDACRRMRNLDGVVVTVPHKIAVCPLLDAIGDAGTRIGAVNAVRREADGRLVGDNFDGAGCVRGLAAAGHRIAGRRALVVGAGGAGAAVAHALADAGAGPLTIFDTDGDRAATLAARVAAARPAARAEVGPPDPRGFDMVVNCTPLGMKAEDPYPVDPDRLDAGALVVDVILRPAVSPLLEAAAARGCATQPGVRMLEGQVAAIAEFFGVPS